MDVISIGLGDKMVLIFEWVTRVHRSICEKTKKKPKSMEIKVGSDGGGGMQEQIPTGLTMVLPGANDTTPMSSSLRVPSRAK